MKDYLVAIGVGAGIICTVSVIGVVLSAGVEAQQPMPATTGSSQVVAASSFETDDFRYAPPSNFTKAEFERFVIGKTKAEIRSAFGSPTSVLDSSDSWWYSQLDIDVVDEFAGTRTGVTIRFDGIPSAESEAIDVRF